MDLKTIVIGCIFVLVVLAIACAVAYHFLETHTANAADAAALAAVNKFAARLRAEGSTLLADVRDEAGKLLGKAVGTAAASIAAPPPPAATVEQHAQAAATAAATAVQASATGSAASVSQAIQAAVATSSGPFMGIPSSGLMPWQLAPITYNPTTDGPWAAFRATNGLYRRYLNPAGVEVAGNDGVTPIDPAQQIWTPAERPK